MDITGVGNLSCLYNYGISDSDTRHVTGKENCIGSVDENGKQKECQTCKNRKYADGSDENVSYKSAAHIAPGAAGNMSTDQMKQMYRLRVPRMFPKKI